MKMKKITGPVALGLSAVAILAVLVVGWFMLVSPQRSKANTLDTQIGTLDAQLADAQHLLAAPNRRQTAATLASARRALPDTPQMSNVLRQLSAAAAKSRTELDTITPGLAVPGFGAAPLPMTVVVKGRYFAIQKFARLLRQSADVKSGKLAGKGRLYTIDSIGFTGQAPAQPGQSSNGAILATLAMNAYTYSATAPPPVATTSTDTTTTSDSTASAAGATP
jgi:Tfp pilus assembly protein PilO